ncbi:hypothetical protein AAG906_006973 [Vitis piasezkii]
MLLYEEDGVQNGNMYYFEGYQGKSIELKKTTTYEELLKIVCHILKVDPTKHNLSMKYVFNGNIPTTPLQLRDDGDVKFFIRLNCTNGKLPISFCITIEKRSGNHGYESIINTDFGSRTLFEVEKEINMDPIFINSSESLSDFDDENRTRLSYDPLNCFDSHNMNMNKDDEDGGMNVNPNKDSQVMQIDVMEEVVMEYESHAEQSIEEPFIVCYSETSDDYMEEHQIYSNKK